MASVLLSERRGSALVLTISDPATRNALSPRVYEVGAAALREAAGDAALRTIVLRGDGAHFCAGGDLQRLAASRDGPADQVRAGIDRYYSDKAFTMKVIAKYTKEKDPDIIDRTYEFYRKAGFKRDLLISEPGVQGILDFLSETVPEAKKATSLQFFDDRLVRQLNSGK